MCQLLYSNNFGQTYKTMRNMKHSGVNVCLGVRSPRRSSTLRSSLSKNII